MDTNKRPVGRPRKTHEVSAPPKQRGEKLRIAAMRARSIGAQDHDFSYPVQAPKLPPGVVPDDVTAPVMAMDATTYDYLNQVYSGGGFPGYAYLSQLATRSEYRAFAQTLGTEITREWIEFTSKHDDDEGVADKIKLIEDEFKRLNVREVIQRAAEHDCYFGRAQIFVGLKGHDRDTPLILSPKTVKPGSLELIAPVEAMWTTPSSYNTIDPAAVDFYRPSRWFMLGREVHSSRLLTVITRPLPDMLKPAFNFGGMSLSQLAEPYVENWLRTRQSVSDLINNFSITILATSMDQVLQGDDDGTDLFARADLFTAARSNKGLALLDKDREEIIQVNTPLSGLHELQAQSQEHMCSVSRMPAIVLTGISPSGLNASSDGEIRVFYDWVAAQQEAYWRAPIEVILKCVQLSLFGEIDPDIGFTFIPLYQMTPKEESEIRAADGTTDCAYINAGVLDPSEVREKLARDPHSGYDGLDTSLLIVQPNEPDDVDPFAQDAEFKEGDHPRAENGQFMSGTAKVKNKHSPEQMAKWAEEKRQRERAQISARVKESEANKERAERAANAVETSAIAPNLTPEEISSIKYYYLSGDRHAAQAEGRNATISAIERAAKENGLEIDHVSESEGGKSKSLYIKVGGDVVRVSDHELPMTPERMANRARGLTGRWNREVVITDWQTTSLDDYIAEIKGNAKT